MFYIDFGTILLYATFLLMLADVGVLLFNKKIRNWLFYDHILLYFAFITFFGSYLEFILNLVGQNYAYVYVTSHSSIEMDFPLRFASSWSGASGSFYIWTAYMFVGYLIFRFIFRKMMDQKIYQYASVILGTNLIAFLVFIIIKDPFAINNPIPTDGTGLNPLLATFLNLIHPPIIFLGYSIFVIPFAIGLAKIITGLTDSEAPAELQRFMRFTMALAWLILGTGILIGGYWAYTTLGWGGFWAWDPVETGSLIPWLFALVFFHGSPVFKLEKGNFGKDIIATFPFLAVIFATIVTRTGLLASVHAFGLSVSDYIIIVYLLAIGIIELFFILKLYQTSKIKFFFTLEELKTIKRQDAALYISFFAFLIGTLSIATGLIIPLIFAMLPAPYNQTFSVDTHYFNVIIGLFGFAALEAAFFTDFVFIKKDNNKLAVIAFGVSLGLLNVFLNLPIVNYYLKRANLGIFYNILEIFSTSSLIANFMLPIIVLSTFVLLITVYKFFRSKEMQKQVKMRKISQTFLHLGILIALIGALFSYNNTIINDIQLNPSQSGFITTNQNAKLEVLDVNYQHDLLNFAQRLEAHVQVTDNGHIIGKGLMDYTNYNEFGVVTSVLIISTPTQDIYLTIMTFTVNSANDGITNIQFQIRIIPLIGLLWTGASLVMLSMAVLVVISLRLFIFSYRKAQTHNLYQNNKPEIRKHAIKG